MKDGIISKWFNSHYAFFYRRVSRSTRGVSQSFLGAPAVWRGHGGRLCWRLVLGFNQDRFSWAWSSADFLGHKLWPSLVANLLKLNNSAFSLCELYKSPGFWSVRRQLSWVRLEKLYFEVILRLKWSCWSLSFSKMDGFFDLADAKCFFYRDDDDGTTIHLAAPNVWRTRRKGVASRLRFSTLD